MNYTQIDRKQVFGSEELDEAYMGHIKKVFEERIRHLTRETGITMPLTNWVN